MRDWGLGLGGLGAGGLWGFGGLRACGLAGSGAQGARRLGARGSAARRLGGSADRRIGGSAARRIGGSAAALLAPAGQGARRPPPALKCWTFHRSVSLPSSCLYHPFSVLQQLHKFGDQRTWAQPNIPTKTSAGTRYRSRDFHAFGVSGFRDSGLSDCWALPGIYAGLFMIACPVLPTAEPFPVLPSTSCV